MISTQQKLWLKKREPNFQGVKSFSGNDCRYDFLPSSPDNVGRINTISEVSTKSIPSGSKSIWGKLKRKISLDYRSTAQPQGNSRQVSSNFYRSTSQPQGNSHQVSSDIFNGVEGETMGYTNMNDCHAIHENSLSRQKEGEQVVNKTHKHASPTIGIQDISNINIEEECEGEEKGTNTSEVSQHSKVFLKKHHNSTDPLIFPSENTEQVITPCRRDGAYSLTPNLQLSTEDLSHLSELHKNLKEKRVNERNLSIFNRLTPKRWHSVQMPISGNNKNKKNTPVEPQSILSPPGQPGNNEMLVELETHKSGSKKLPSPRVLPTNYHNLFIPVPKRLHHRSTEFPTTSKVNKEQLTYPRGRKRVCSFPMPKHAMNTYDLSLFSTLPEKGNGKKRNEDVTLNMFNKITQILTSNSIDFTDLFNTYENDMPGKSKSTSRRLLGDLRKNNNSIPILSMSGIMSSTNNGKSLERKATTQNESKSKSSRVGRMLTRKFTSQNEKLLQHAVTHKDFDMLEKLLSHDNFLSEINYLEPPGVSVFHQACVFGDFNTIQLLLTKGADVCLKTWSKLSPLRIAAMFGHYKVAQLLLLSGADLNDIKNGFQVENNSSI